MRGSGIGLHLTHSLNNTGVGRPQVLHVNVNFSISIFVLS